MAAGSSVIHAYGVVAADAAQTAWPAGIASAPVSSVTVDGGAALVSRLPATQFAPETWEQHADDPAWLGAIAVGHHRVLQAAIDANDVVPFRLPSLYGDVEALRQALRDRTGAVAEAMRRVHGRVEWGVKIFRVETPGTDEPPAGSGSDYLRSRSERLRTRAERDRRLRDRVGECYERLQELSDAAVCNAPQDPALSGRREPMLLNAACLVPRAGRDRFGDGVDELTSACRVEGLSLEVSGPWPPYNFAVPADQEEV